MRPIETPSTATMAPHDWALDLEQFTHERAAIPSWGVRASCLRNWAMQYRDAIQSHPYEPNKRALSAVMSRLGFLCSNKFLDGQAERIYYKTPDGRAASVHHLYVFIKGRWIDERELGSDNQGRALRSPS